MIKLLLVLAVLLLVAVIVVLLARRVQRRESLQRTSENQRWYQQRLQELDEDRAAGRVDDEDYHQARLELDKTFVTDNKDIEQGINWQPIKPWLPMALLIIISLGFYAGYGSWNLQRQADDALQQLPELGKRVLQQQQEVDTDTLSTFALGLRQKLQRQGDDPVAWWIYAGLMTDLNQFDQANSAFEKSLTLDPDRTGTLVSYARFLLQNGNESNLQKAGQLLARTLKIEPDNVEAISLSGFVAYETGNYEQAINAWQQLLRLTPESSPRRTAVEQAIADAKQQQQRDLQQLTVTVDINDQLRQQLPQNGTLFVYVTAVDGVPMPAAVKRVPATDFPITVTLSNQDSMLPELQLSSLEQWKVQARVSQDDKIELQPGDLNAEPRVIKAVDAVNVELQLSERQP